MYNIQHIFYLAIIAAAIAMMAILSSCKTCIPVVEYRDSIRVEYKLDSTYVYLHDSIYRDRWHSGDTEYVQVKEYHTIYKDKIVLQHDTISKTEKDMQQIEVVPKFYRGCTIALWIVIAILAIGIAVRILIRVYLKK